MEPTCLVPTPTNATGSGISQSASDITNKSHGDVFSMSSTSCKLYKILLVLQSSISMCLLKDRQGVGPYGKNILCPNQ